MATSSTGLSEIHGAVLAAIRTYPAIVGKVALKIFDGSANSDTTFPYITVDGWASAQRDGLNFSRRNVTFMVHVYSAYKGNAEVYSIGDDVIGCLDKKQVPLSTWHSVLVEFDQSDVIVETNEVRHMWMRFSAILTRR